MKRLLWILLIILACIALFFAWNTWHNKTPKPAPDNIPAITSAQTSATVLTPAKPLIDFVLQDFNGQVFNQDNLKGYWTLMFFGYADCPEICPTTLAITSGVWRAFPEQIPHPKARFVFATLDPKTDTPQKLKTFLSRFNPAFIGITGEEAEVHKLSKSLNVYSWTDPKLNAAGQKIIDHSATIMLINPEGRLHALFTPPHQIDTIKKDLQTLMNR